ncbi:hypothetical protein HF086_015573 [Spodoptera exigua]|uniref:Uncharacterized protein n=1 Tax=Spodoptera exigua TaxID=7107 RepID=A0A922SEH0_SPOEX|nr:hypothetical protein HF086_015573 [Spodoptera exigua]
MFHKFAVLSGLVLSATCMVLHQPQIPVLLGLQYDSNPNYNFAYEVNDVHTGDIKSQHESRRGDTVLGQYSLLQPDGIRRTVDYRADDHTGFQASVNNARGAVASHAQAAINGDVTRHPNLAVQSYQSWPTPTAHPSPAPSPVAISRSSFSQTITHGAPVHHPWA